MPDALKDHWLSAVQRPDVRAALEAVYARASSEITARGPACWGSGRCCNFDRAGHRLYVTGLEAAYTLALQPTHRSAASSKPGAPLSLNQITVARDSGGCPFQVANLCSVHTIKPLGCRVYFCDRSAQDWQHALSETLLTDIRQLHTQFNIEYRYGEWRTMLEQLAIHDH